MASRTSRHRCNSRAASDSSTMSGPAANVANAVYARRHRDHITTQPRQAA
ncbi:hypothetical protein [Actinoallomurus sp. CA-150999]